MLARPAPLSRLRRALARSAVVALVGPRQCGKTTLARQLVPPESSHYFDLEDPVGIARLETPRTALESLRGLVVIDEVQRRPELFPVLRVLADRRPRRARFLVLGSASPELLRQSSESLVGRLEIVEMGGFSLAEVGVAKLDRLWLRGAFPRAFLARSADESLAWRRELVRTFLEREVRALGVTLPPAALLRFWSMLAHGHGGLWRASDPARSLGITEPTVRRYLDALSGLFLVRQLQPWHENLGKRQVKAPKIYLQDSGLLHQILGIRSLPELLAHPRSGASFEGFVIEQILSLLRPEAAYFWATHTGAELDLLLLHRGRRLGVEIKRSDAPTLTPSMRHALSDLRLDALVVVYPGTLRYTLPLGVEVVPVAELGVAGGEALFRRRSRAGTKPT